MGVLKFTSSKSLKNSCSNIKDYLEKENEKEESRAIKKSSENINDIENWDKEMEMTKVLYDKKDGRQYTHIIQSFDKEPDNPNYNPEKINQAGEELIKKYADEGYQIVIVTHDDTDNLHNHIIINSVNLETGEKIQMSNKDTEELRKKNDEICKEYGLRTLDESKELKDQREKEQGRQPESRKTDEKWIADRGESWKSKEFREPLQEIFNRTDIKNEQDFEKALEEKNLEIKKEYNNGAITYRNTESNHRLKSTSTEKKAIDGFGSYGRKDIEELYERNKELEQEKEMEKEQQQEREMEQEKEFERDRDREEKNSRDHSRSNSNYERGGYER